MGLRSIGLPGFLLIGVVPYGFAFLAGCVSKLRIVALFALCGQQGKGCRYRAQWSPGGQRNLTVWIDGQMAVVSFACRALEFQGLHQINVQIPAGVRRGMAVP